MTQTTSPYKTSPALAANGAVAMFHYSDLRRFLDQLEWSLRQEAALVRLYGSLLKLAPEDACSRQLQELLAEDRKHYVLLEDLFRELRGRDPLVRPEPAETFDCYEDGARKAIAMALEAAKRYRDTYLLTPSPRVRDIFFLTMTDETDHVARLWLSLRN
ncbi:ferritin-like domain-containing protein [Gordoniibacillus kamchatkensis]|uniref:ferritin-like domain-containing protein n=1 Tax=Gordoniibacillus kamchatkensis TaxID=1590651 RepID=UPI0006966120|nr:ferritin-like domain-containing protein [Paenibacillus sp. VKM B-2647]